MNNEPLVSIIIPAYNAEGYIKRALKSALGQTYKNIEIVVIDDGSTDKTAQIVKLIYSPKIVYIYQENQGLGAARNNGIKASKGQYITFLDADDYYLSEKIEKQVEFLQNRPDDQVVYCDFISFYSKAPLKFLKKIHKKLSGDVLKYLLKSCFINPNTIMLKRQVLENVGLFNEQRYYPEDWKIWLDISLAGFKFSYLDEALVVIEMREESLTRMENRLSYVRNTLKMFEEIFLKMDDNEKNTYQAERILKRIKLQLSIVYLINGQKTEFFKTFIGLCRIKIFSYPIGWIFLLLPSGFLKICLAKLWKLYQLRSYKVIKEKICLLFLKVI